MIRQFTLTLLIAFVATLAWGCNRHAALSADAPTGTQASTAKLTETPADDPDEVDPGEAKTDDINPPPDEIPKLGTTLKLSEAEWRERLTDPQFDVLRNAGTEYPGSGAYLKFKGDGTFHCSACNNPLFDSKTKYESYTGWPSFYTPIEEGRVGEVEDLSGGMVRTEVVCAHCGGHLGHVFKDGPKPTGLRYCINSISLYFRPR